jgi:hypothetical protein
MWRTSARLLIGLFLLVGAGCCVVWAGFGFQYVWQKQVVVAAKKKPVPLIDSKLAQDPSIRGAKIQMIGPLAHAMNGKGKSDAAEIASVVSVDEGDSSAGDGTAAEDADGRPSADPAVPFNLVGYSRAQQPQRFRATFQLRTYRYFHLVVPPHATSPRVQGTFSAALAKNKSADLADFLVLDGDQLKDFARGGAPEPIFSHESSQGVIDVQLSPTILDGKDYYLVFSNPDRRARTVTADFTATFD